MKLNYRNKFSTEKAKFGFDPLSTNLFTWLENGFLIALTLSFILCKYIPFLNTNTMTLTFLRYYTIAFIALQSVLKATTLFKTVSRESDVYTKKNLYRGLAFIGAFAVAVTGILAFNKGQVTVSEMLTALGMSVFPFSLTEMFDETTSYLDLMMNGVYAILLGSGLGSVYLGKNMMGLFCVLALGLRGVYGFMKDKFEKKSEVMSKEHLVTIGLAGLSIIMMIGCYVRKVNMELPDMNVLFGKVAEAQV